MIKRITLALILLAVLLAAPVAAFASDTSTAKYYGVITISNNSTATTNVATVMTANTTALIAADYMNSSANNTAILSSSGSDVAYMPGYGPSGNPWALWVPSIGANAYSSDILYMGGTANMSPKLRYFPASGGMTISDDASLEPSDNFSTTLANTWVDTTQVGEDLFRKENALSANITASGEITASIYDYPNIRDTEVSTDDAYNTSLVVNLPTLSAGDLLVMAVSADGTVLPNLSTPAGWTQLWHSATGVTSAGYYKVSNGAEGANVTLTADQDSYGSGIVYAFKDYTGTPEAGTVATGTSANPNPPALTPSWGITATLWIAVSSNDHTDTVSAYPASYSSGLNGVSLGGGTGTAIREYTAASENPGTFTLSGSEEWAAQTIAIKAGVVPVTATGVSSGEISPQVTYDKPFLSLNPDGTATPPVTDNLTLNAPLWQPESDNATFTTIDSNAFTGTVTNAVWSSSGYVFNDDTNDNIDFGADIGYTNGPFTLDFWLYPHAPDENFTDPISIVADADNYLQLSYRNTNYRFNVEWEAQNIHDTIYTPDNSIPINTWTNVTITWNGVNTITAYVNGSVSGTPQTADTAPVGTWGMAAGRVRGGANYYDGLVGNIIFYNGLAFSPTEILQNYNATKSKYTTGDIYTYSTLASVPDNANDWIIGGDATPYIGQFDIDIGGVNKASIDWEYGTTFTDASGNGNDAAPTFRTTSSDADVSASLSFFQPVSEAKAPAYSLSSTPDLLTTTPGMSSTFTANITSAPTYPGRAVVQAMAVAGQTPEQVPTLLIFGVVIVAMSLSLSYFMRQFGDMSIVWKSGIIVVMMSIGVAIKVFDIWQIYFFVILSWGILEWKKRSRTA